MSIIQVTDGIVRIVFGDGREVEVEVVKVSGMEQLEITATGGEDIEMQTMSANQVRVLVDA
jgi:hypothetical protein